jgi:hypothetical protein
MLSALSGARAEFMLIGAHARAAYGIPRATGDMDVWVRPTPENALRVFTALAAYGAPLHDLTVEDLSKPGVVFQIGLPPYRIDILTQISGLSFEEAWPKRMYADFGGATYAVISREDFIRNKRAAGRPKDLADVIDVENQ